MIVYTHYTGKGKQEFLYEKPTKVHSTCMVGHTATHEGEYAQLHSDVWLSNHVHEDALECDTCYNLYLPEHDGTQTYNGEWFCSETCATQAGW